MVNLRKYGTTRRELALLTFKQMLEPGDATLGMSLFEHAFYALKGIACLYWGQRKSSDGEADVVDVARFGSVTSKEKTWFELVVFPQGMFYDIVENGGGDE